VKGVAGYNPRESNVWVDAVSEHDVEDQSMAKNLFLFDRFRELR
jgi:hypothetical protein